LNFNWILIAITMSVEGSLHEILERLLTRQDRAEARQEKANAEMKAAQAETEARADARQDSAMPR
jgi:hypothetical protein